MMSAASSIPQLSAEEPIRNPDLGPALRPDAFVRSEARLGDQRLHAGEAGCVGDQLETFEQPLRGLGAALDLEAPPSRQTR